MDVPHALLDILRGCNLKCRACYNHEDTRIKPVHEIEAEIETLLKQRHIQSISIVGGEPLLHPHLFEIVRILKRRGLYVELFTNGLLLDEQVCVCLKTSGVNLVFLHIDSGQQRPDLPNGSTIADRQQLIRDKAALLTTNGLEAGLAITAYPDQFNEIMEGTRLTLSSPDLGYMLVTRFRDHTGIQAIRGNLTTGLTAKADLPPASATAAAHSHHDMQLLLRHEFGFRPFAYLGSNRSPHDARWLSYLIGTTKTRSGHLLAHSIKASRFERFFTALHRHITGRYPFYIPWSAKCFCVQLLFNALSGGHITPNFQLLLASFMPGSRLHAKRILFQNPAEVDAAGTVTHCLNCPDAVLRNGQLVPVCLADLCK